jgi:AcrR family transcriptional regulator
MPTYQKPPTVNDDARAQDIYREAASIISDKGFDATSMGDIAETVDLTKGGLYYYIKGKKALLFAIMNFALDLLERRIMEEAREIRDGKERLEYLLSGYVQLLLDEPSAMAILVNEDEKLDPTYRPRIMERKKAYSDYLRDCIAEVQPKGSDINAEIAAYSMLGMVHGALYGHKLCDIGLSEPELGRQLAHIALRGLLPDS